MPFNLSKKTQTKKAQFDYQEFDQPPQVEAGSENIAFLIDELESAILRSAEDAITKQDATACIRELKRIFPH